MMNVFQSGIASFERVIEFLDAEEQSPDPAASADPPPVAGPGRVLRRHVLVRPGPPAHRVALAAWPNRARPIAIVGPTGAGKTTLVNLIMRFYELNDGAITLDGRDISSIPRHELRSKIGMVLQDTWLFGGTIRDNIAYGNPDATEEQILEAARATYVDRFVHSLPDGYDTLINEEGDNISAGQKQLLTIARAFLADPAILILDEATSSVDTRTEVLIQEAMNALRHGPHELRDRAPAVDHPRRRRHPRDGERPHRRAGLAQRAARARRPVLPPLQLAVRGARRRHRRSTKPSAPQHAYRRPRWYERADVHRERDGDVERGAPPDRLGLQAQRAEHDAADDRGERLGHRLAVVEHVVRQRHREDRGPAEPWRETVQQEAAEEELQRAELQPVQHPPRVHVRPERVAGRRMEERDTSPGTTAVNETAMINGAAIAYSAA